MAAAASAGGARAARLARSRDGASGQKVPTTFPAYLCASGQYCKDTPGGVQAFAAGWLEHPAQPSAASASSYCSQHLRFRCALGATGWVMPVCVVSHVGLCTSNMLEKDFEVGQAAAQALQVSVLRRIRQAKMLPQKAQLPGPNGLAMISKRTAGFLPLPPPCTLVHSNHFPPSICRLAARQAIRARCCSSGVSYSCDWRWARDRLESFY